MPEPKSNNKSYREDLKLIAKAVREAGAIAKQAFDDNDSKVWDKANDSPVTDADIAVNDYLAQILQAARPDYGWLSDCLLYTSPSPRDKRQSRMPSSA